MLLWLNEVLLTTTDPTISDVYADNTLVSIESPIMPAACLAVFNLRFGTGSSGWASKLSLYFFPTPVVSYKTYSRSGIFICTPVGSESSSSSADGNTLTFSTKLRC